MKTHAPALRTTWSQYASLPLRLMLGFAFCYHGYPKLFAEGGHAEFVGTLQQIGVAAPEVMAWLIGILEFAGGIALILGALVTVVSALLAIEMAIAAATVHAAAGFSFMNVIGQTETGMQFGMPGYEVNLLYIAGLATLMLIDPGPLSLDGLWLRSRYGKVTRRVEHEQRVVEPAGSPRR